jgi:hypothetical protein
MRVGRRHSVRRCRRYVLDGGVWSAHRSKACHCKVQHGLRVGSDALRAPRNQTLTRRPNITRAARRTTPSRKSFRTNVPASQCRRLRFRVSNVRLGHFRVGRSIEAKGERRLCFEVPSVRMLQGQRARLPRSTGAVAAIASDEAARGLSATFRAFGAPAWSPSHKCARPSSSRPDASTRSET